MRRFALMIDQQPQSKNIGASDAIAFQHAVLKQLEVRGQSAYTGPVFLRLDFFNKSKTPPSIYKLPKNYLDLLERPRADAGISRKRLLYRNDRQVKGLVVRYHIDGPFDKPQIWVEAEPFRDFLADVDLVDRVGRDDFEDDRNWWRSSRRDEFRNGPFHNDDGFNEEFDRLIEFERKKDAWLHVLSSDAYEAQRLMMRLNAQQEHLRRTDQFTCQGLLHVFQQCQRTKVSSHHDMMLRLASMSRDMTFGPPFVLELHHAPHREGDSDAFRAKLRSALQNFKAKHRLLFPLVTLLNVTILVVPPEGGGKDLDNLARLILPALHEIWTPPSHIAHVFEMVNVKRKGHREHWDSELAILPKEPRHSITEYRVFELPRSPEDSKDGFVRLAVGGGMTPIRFREDIEAYLERWRDSLER